MRWASLPWMALAVVLPGAALAHGGQPQVQKIVFDNAGAPIAVTDNQGIFAAAGRDFRWLCEDAFVPGVGVLDVAVLGGDRPRWFIAAGEGLYFSDDGGCTPHPVGGALAGHRPAALSPHPEAPDELLVATQSFGRRNEVFRTTDRGRTWTPAGLDSPFQVQQLLRAEADPRRIYVRGTFGASRSNDGGRRFAPISLGPPELDPRPENFQFLGTAPNDADVVFAALEGFPDTHLLRSTDGGASWRAVTALDDFPLSLVVSQDGLEALVQAPFAGVRRSVDGGLSWSDPAPPAVDRLDCLTRAPDSDRIWGCTNIFANGAWAVGSSDDFARSFTPRLVDFADASRWACPPETRGGACCDWLCPGLPPGGVCGDARPEAEAVCAVTPIEPAPDGGALDGALPDGAVLDGAVPDAGPDAAMPDLAALDQALPDQALPDLPLPDRAVPDLALPDLGGPPDLSARPDALVDGAPADAAIDVGYEPTPALGSGDSGCKQGPGDGDGHGVWASLALLALHRQRRPRPNPKRSANHHGAD